MNTRTETTAPISAGLAAVAGVEVRHLCDISIDLELQAVPTPAGTKMIFGVVEGRAEGERLSGSFTRNSGDWVNFGSDRIGRIDVRATLVTDDDAPIYFTNIGRVGPLPDDFAELGPGERTRWDETYARSAPVFETGDERYAWLNGILTVGIHEVSLDHVDYRLFEVL